MQQCNAMKSPIIQIFSNEDIEKPYNHKSTFYRQIVLKKIVFLTNYCSLRLFFSNDLVAEGGASAPPPCTPVATAMGGFQEQSQCFPVGMICSFFFISYYFIFFLLPWVGSVGLGPLD